MSGGNEDRSIENDSHEIAVVVSGESYCGKFIAKRALETPNDPKLSDGGAWRGSCVVERSEGIRAREKGGSDETGSS